MGDYTPRRLRENGGKHKRGSRGGAAAYGVGAPGKGGANSSWREHHPKPPAAKKTPCQFCGHKSCTKCTCYGCELRRAEGPVYRVAG